MTIRNIIEEFVYKHIEHYANIVYKGGYDTVIDGIKVLDDPFAVGALINVTCELYVYYKREEDEKADVTLDMIERFISYTNNRDVKTWGKLSILRGLSELKKNGLLEMLSDESIAICEIKTRYDDFFDKNTMQLINYANNYYQVAFSCAGYREFIGWDKEILSDKISEKLLSIMQESNGWMDDQPGANRFDRYSFMIPSEAVDSYLNLSKSIPELYLNNLNDSLSVVLFMANNRGDSLNYGRSTSCYGDSSSCEIIGSAFAAGIVPDDKKYLAIDYSIRSLQKEVEFWYDKKQNSFNIWNNGRTTNEYRNISRLLETNIDMSIHFLSILHNFERANMADVQFMDSIPSPTKWSVKRVVFKNDEDRTAQLIILRKGNMLVQLPFIGGGVLSRRCTYQPFPYLCNVNDACPNGEYPYLIPEYTDKYLNILRPNEFYNKIEISDVNGVITIIASGKMNRRNGTNPIKSEYSFKSTYKFEENLVTVLFENDIDKPEATMITGEFNDENAVEVLGFDCSYEIPINGKAKFRTPHGAYKHVYVHDSMNCKEKLGYKITLY